MGAIGKGKITVGVQVGEPGVHRALVREEIADLLASGRELPAIVTRPMCEPAGA